MSKEKFIKVVEPIITFSLFCLRSVFVGFVIYGAYRNYIKGEVVWSCIALGILINYVIDQVYNAPKE
tara:strand:- start:204 stop:404 length:201 start_codon:yes stop_codon:yes gene_type:complete